jgi:hypothetical protein
MQSLVGNNIMDTQWMLLFPSSISIYVWNSKVLLKLIVEEAFSELVSRNFFQNFKAYFNLSLWQWKIISFP